MSEDLKDQGGYGEAQPFDRDPPPADEDPPEDAVVDVFQPGFADHLYVYVLASASGTGHGYCLHSVDRKLTARDRRTL